MRNPFRRPKVKALVVLKNTHVVRSSKPFEELLEDLNRQLARTPVAHEDSVYVLVPSPDGDAFVRASEIAYGVELEPIEVTR
jgi:hypothetical protein